jgi:DNA-binding response OmpR family regulator
LNYGDPLPFFFRILRLFCKKQQVKILIVEDEPAMNQSMVDYLTTMNYTCESVSSYQEALEKVELFDYDCIVLDIMLPGGSGLNLIKVLKQDRKTDGVIVISAKGALEDKLVGLQLGADDYLTKPFHLSELSVRIAAIIRRRQFNGQSLIHAGDITVNIEAKQVTVNDKVLELTQKEFQILLFFLANRNRVLSKNAIALHLLGDEMDMADNYDFLYTHIKNLRRKIIVAGGADVIKSVYGVGYKLQLP